jgi:L1 cell adhesion molecule like protein
VINKEINGCLAWIENNNDAEVTAFEGKQKELEGKLMPLMQAAYQAEAGGSGGPSRFAGCGGFAGGGGGGFPGGIDPSTFGGGGSASDGGGSRDPRVEEMD